jgi:hypothetical protein
MFEEICKASNILKDLLIHGLGTPVGGILE